MGTSFRIAKIFQIPVLLHWSLVLVAGFILYLSFDKNLTFQAVVWLSAAAFALFFSILLHEFGHALMARRYGVETKDIILLPLGGLARLNKLPETPLQEFFVAIAGPLVNFAIALLLFPYLFFITAPGIQERGAPAPDGIIGDFFYFLPFLFAMNIGLGVFNLIPAFPMDGGRILRAILSSWLGKLQGTRIAVLAGQIIAIGMAVFGIASQNYLYVLIGAFVFFTGLKEFRWVKMETLMSRFSVKDLAKTDYPRLYLSDSLRTAFELFSNSEESHLPVFNEHQQWMGTLSEEVVFALAERRMLEEPVAGHFHPDERFLSMTHSLKEANEIFYTTGSEILPVVENGSVAGVLNREDVMNYLHSQNKK